MSATSDNRIDLVDNSDRSPRSENMSESQTQAPTENKENVQPGKEEGSAAWYSKPESVGNSAGEKIEETLSPVGQFAGKGLETIAKPVGGLVEPLVGGVMKGGQAWGDTLGVGFGNAEGGPAKQQEAEHKNLKEGLGGKEQNAENPLGL